MSRSKGKWGLHRCSFLDSSLEHFLRFLEALDDRTIIGRNIHVQTSEFFVVRAVPMLLEFAHDRIGAGGDNTGL